jgi:hypothetical protein
MSAQAYCFSLFIDSAYLAIETAELGKTCTLPPELSR